MDSLTQIVLGAAVGEAVLGKKVGNKAMLYGAIAGTIPDLDIFYGYFTDTITYLETHRGVTHSIIFALFMAPIFGWLISKIERKSNANWKDWTILMFWGLFTHSLLDAFTTWGTHLFWPLDYPVSFHSIFVIDPLYTLPLLIFLLLAMFQKRTSAKRRKYNRLGLILSSSYLLLTLIVKGITYNQFKTALDNQEIEYIKIQNRPSPFNIVLWTANVETEDAFLIGDYSFFDSQPIHFSSYPKNHHLVAHLKEKRNLQRLIHIAEGWFIISEKNGALYFNDLRFGLLNNDPKNPQFVFSYLIEKDNGDISISEAPKNREDARKLLSTLWKRIKGN